VWRVSCGKAPSGTAVAGRPSAAGASSAGHVIARLERSEQADVDLLSPGEPKKNEAAGLPSASREVKPGEETKRTETRRWAAFVQSGLGAGHP
jgi:hypothetical protein